MDQSSVQSVLTLAGCLGLAAPTVYFSPWLWRQFYMARVRQQFTRNRLLALTYDDGPDRVVTPQLLDLFRAYGAHATFFMLGVHAEKMPDLVGRVVQEGHDIGCHSYRHLNAWKVFPWTALADLDRGIASLSTWTREKPIYRPTYGKSTLPTFFHMRRRKATPWWWTIDSGDSHARVPHCESVVEKVRRENGGIVLMHDGSMAPRAANRVEFVLQSTELLLKTAREEAFTVVRLGHVCS